MSTKYNAEELQAAWVADLLADAEASERQAHNGPFYTDKGITPDALLRYAADCRKQAESNHPMPTFRNY